MQKSESRWTHRWRSNEHIMVVSSDFLVNNHTIKLPNESIIVILRPLTIFNIGAGKSHCRTTTLTETRQSNTSLRTKQKFTKTYDNYWKTVKKIKYIRISKLKLWIYRMIMLFDTFWWLTEIFRALHILIHIAQCNCTTSN